MTSHHSPCSSTSSSLSVKSANLQAAAKPTKTPQETVAVDDDDQTTPSEVTKDEESADEDLDRDELSTATILTTTDELSASTVQSGDSSAIKLQDLCNVSDRFVSNGCDTRTGELQSNNETAKKNITTNTNTTTTTGTASQKRPSLTSKGLSSLT